MERAAPVNKIESLVSRWRDDPVFAESLVHVEEIPARSGDDQSIPADLHPQLVALLAEDGITSLYSHQRKAIDLIRTGRHVAIVTGTASGKTLCYNLPVADAGLSNPQARAIYLFPTKALTQDQHKKLSGWIERLEPDSGLSCAIYDGDTPTAHRSAVRSQARVVMTNPDMLHLGILPHHTQWSSFFRALRFVVIDEMHTYRGVLGSHFANVLRRLQRIAAFYGSYPQFILTSATIANPRELAENLVEQAVTVVDEDGAPAGRKYFILYNPPIINPTLGIRSSPLVEGQRLVSDLMAHGQQSIAFAQTRRAVEHVVRYLRDLHPDRKNQIEGYRSGYLPNERRAIERSLREGHTKAVIATNALELGIDIGSLDASVIIGFPGTVASTRQQAGRAGRKTGTSLAVLVATSTPLDQYLMQHPEYVLGRSPEQALIDPNNPMILLQHLRCAAFELPFKPGQTFGRIPYEEVAELLDTIAETGDLHAAAGKYFWTADAYPASQISLRSSTPDSVKLQAEMEDGRPQIVGIVDRPSALWMVHPEAVYLHAGQSYFVEELDLERGLARLTLKDLDYYTQSMSNTEVEKIAENLTSQLPGASRFYGDLKVTTQVTGFKRLRWYTRENLGESPLDLPPSELFTSGYWISLSESTVDALRQAGLWTGDPNQYGPGWDRLRQQIRSRDRYTCQMCGATENGSTFHVHHKIPFRQFPSAEEANRPDNLVTLCPGCHQAAEASLRIRSGLAGLSYLFHNLAPLFLMCDINDIETYADPQSPLADGQPVIALYDMIPLGIGLARKVYDIDVTIYREAASLIRRCGCRDGCPSCVGPGGVRGSGGKRETLALLSALLTGQVQPEVL